tara:strand:- start:34 stop:348 length:315 start_codon:yes stop_codon:yes gene_type:complete
MPKLGVRKHLLLTKEIERKFEKLGDQEGTEDPIIVVKFFTPTSNWTWYAIAYYPDERLFFGLVDGFEKELGYFSLDELESVRCPLGLPIERDMYFGEHRLSEFK